MTPDTWVNPYRMTAWSYETMVMVCEGRIQVQPGRTHRDDAPFMPRAWRYVGGPAPRWADEAQEWVKRFIPAGLVEPAVEDSPGAWTPLALTLAGAVLLDTWRKHPFVVIDQPQ